MCYYFKLADLLIFKTIYRQISQTDINDQTRKFPDLVKTMDEEFYFMTRDELLEKTLRSYAAYYDVNRDCPEEPFVAEAVFHSHNDAYFLVKSARIGEAESNEYVFFASVDNLDRTLLEQLDTAAWEIGVSRVRPHSNHRNTDISLIILASSVAEDAARAVPKLKHYKSYRMSLYGFSHYRLFVADLSNGNQLCNAQGRSMKKLFGKIMV